MSDPNGDDNKPIWKVLLSNQQFTSAVRTLLLLVFSSVTTWIVAKGFVTESDVKLFKVFLEAAAPVVGIIATVVWSQMTRTKKAIVSQAAALPEVAVVAIKDDAASKSLQTMAQGNDEKKVVPESSVSNPGNG